MNIPSALAVLSFRMIQGISIIYFPSILTNIVSTVKVFAQIFSQRKISISHGYAD